MKPFFQKNKILLLTLAAVLCFGILFGLMIGGAIRLSVGTRTFTTVADAKEEAAGAQQAVVPHRPEPTATPEPEHLRLSADQVRQITDAVRSRRERVIPVRSNILPMQNAFLWTETVASAEQTKRACEAAQSLTRLLFGQTYRELTGYDAEDAKVYLYTDLSGEREPFLRIMDPDRVYELTVREADLGLINADLLVYPDGPSDDFEKDSIAIAQALGCNARYLRRDSGIFGEQIYEFKTDTEVCLTFSYIGNRLWQVAVHPSQQAMNECEYFAVDIQLDYRTPAYPEAFVEADPPARNGQGLVKGKVEAALKRFYRGLTGETLNTGELTFRFLRDESGAREDCWEITGTDLNFVISAYSGDVISFRGRIPCKDLIEIPYEQMGGTEYEAVTELFGRTVIESFGTYLGLSEEKKTGKIDVNAVYDGHCCTMDIECADGTIYECYFEDGVLTEIWHFANEALFMESPPGWVADAVYLHSVTGKPYIPNYRDWDGDLHVRQRPQN